VGGSGTRPYLDQRHSAFAIRHSPFFSIRYSPFAPQSMGPGKMPVPQTTRAGLGPAPTSTSAIQHSPFAIRRFFPFAIRHSLFAVFFHSLFAIRGF
jgi:hypothetical protein